MKHTKYFLQEKSTALRGMKLGVKFYFFIELKLKKTGRLLISSI